MNLFAVSSNLIVVGSPTRLTFIEQFVAFILIKGK